MTIDTARKKRILILLGEAAYGPRMSSPGIRAHHMARVLVEQVPHATVTVAVPFGNLGSVPADRPFRVMQYTRLTALREIAAHDIIISTAFPLATLLLFPWKTLIFDYFTEYLLEWMEAGRDTGMSEKRRRAWISSARKLLNIQLTFADYVLAASDRQRDARIGSMMSLDLISPSTHDQDPSLRMLVDIAPHGLRPDPLEHTEHVVKGKYAGIRETDKLLLWNGGILSWYDTATLLRAFHQVARERDDVKLLFVGASYPGLGSLGLGERFRQTVELARELGLYNTSVFFDIGWVPYEEMKNYTLESDLSICTYFSGLETNFSLRTRFLDVFWAEVPLICTRGDVLAGMVEEHGLGLTVEPEDASELAGAIRRLLDDRDFYEECRRNIRGVKGCLAWEVVLEPLVEFCRNGSSIARPKRQRLLPLVTRIVGHEFSRRLLAFVPWS